MKTYDYYLHRSGGRVFDYFGGIGEPFKVSLVRFYLWKWLGFRATKVTKGGSKQRVMIRAVEHIDTHTKYKKLKRRTKIAPVRLSM